MSAANDTYIKNLYIPKTINLADGTEINCTRCSVNFINDILVMVPTELDCYFGHWSKPYMSSNGNKIAIGERHKFTFLLSNESFDKNYIIFYNSSNNPFATIETGCHYTGTTPTGTEYVIIRVGITNPTIDNKYYTKIVFLDDGLKCANNCVVFSNPSNNGISGIQVKNYFPFSTERLYISEIEANSTIGIAYGTTDLHDSIQLKVSNSTCYCELYENGNRTFSESYSIPQSPAGMVLQVQNTGRALIIVLFTKDMNRFSQIGRFNYGELFDARKEELITKWKTYVISETTNMSRFDTAGFYRFDSAIRSGSNSVSIRFFYSKRRLDVFPC